MIHPARLGSKLLLLVVINLMSLPAHGGISFSFQLEPPEWE